MTYRVAVAVSGRGSNLVALHEAIDGSDATLALVLSDRDAPALDRATGLGIPTHRLARWDDAEEWIGALTTAAADLVVLAGYLRLVPAAVTQRWRDRIINIHPALLPRHGGPGMYGARVHAAVLAAGDAESGASVHLVDEAYDRGHVLAQARVPVQPGDTPEMLAQRVLAVEHRLLGAAVRAAAAAGRPVPFRFV
ncbi:MAG TPA: phosphoribosylglycinamide formyltransferase [Gemmatimonadales bacterium]|nr:phosphoribosylglycinamide formyltransferase [Gemmatimonadales bacterium]